VGPHGYSLEYHKDYLVRKTGLTPDDPGFGQRVFDVFGFDFLFSVNDGLVSWSQKGRVSDMGMPYTPDGATNGSPRLPVPQRGRVWGSMPSRNTGCRISKRKSAPTRPPSKRRARRIPGS